MRRSGSKQHRKSITLRKEDRDGLDYKNKPHTGKQILQSESPEYREQIAPMLNNKTKGISTTCKET